MVHETKQNIMKTFGTSEKDTGSCQVQIALFSQRIASISAHLKKQPKDFSSQRGLLALVSKRRTYLKYLKKNDAPAYDKLVVSLKEHGFM